MARYAYKVLDLREGARLTAEKLERILNEHAAQGWRLRAMETAESRRMAVTRESLVLIFEREAS